MVGHELTWRQLLWMEAGWVANDRAEWNRASIIIALIHNQWAKRPISPERVNPHTAKDARVTTGTPLTRGNVVAILGSFFPGKKIHGSEG